MGGRALWLLGSLAVWGPPSSSTPRPAGPSLLHWTDTPASGTDAARPGRAGDGREATSPLREGGPLSLTHLLHSELGPSMLYGLTEAGPRGGQGAGADCRRSPQHAPWQRPRPVPRPLCAPVLYPQKWGSSEVLLRRLTCRAWCRPGANMQVGPSSTYNPRRGSGFRSRYAVHQLAPVGRDLTVCASVSPCSKGAGGDGTCLMGLS